MAGTHALISSLIISVDKLLPKVKNFIVTPSSSSAQSYDAIVVEENLNALTKMLKWIEKTLYNVDVRHMGDKVAKLFLKELNEVGHDAEHIIDCYMYEVYRAQLEATDLSDVNHSKRKRKKMSSPSSIRIPDAFVDSIKKITSRFNEILEHQEDFQLYDEDGPRRYERVKFRERTTHFVESKVFGRNTDKEKVIELLLTNIYNGSMIVIPIVGKGGLGKTTLAQLVYSDTRVEENFNLFGWTCFTENFIVERFMQELIESFSSKSCSLKDLSDLDKKVSEIVMGKKVFVVLDDVWNEDKKIWHLLRVPFKSALRVAFIVTTRSDQVAEIMQTTSPFRLDYLSEEDSWTLFQHYSGIMPTVHTKELIDIGENIMKKCGGLPLALKVISNILCYEDEETWTDILENDFKDISAVNDIFPALQVSYIYMPAYLRPCFLYCSLFPKDYEYQVDEMIELWIAQGYIEYDGRILEEIAYNYMVELKERSFIDPIYRGGSWGFKMHDIFHDLARSISGNEFHCIERGANEFYSRPNLSNEIAHIYMDHSNESWYHLNLNNIATLRSLILKVEFGTNTIDLSEAENLRVLKLQNSNFSKNAILPGFVFPKHLRSLELDNTIGGSQSIPLNLSLLYHLERLILNLNNSLIELEALGNLTNLQSLSLSHCTIEELPNTICNLVYLQKLVIHGCPDLCLFPESLCKLSCLKILRLTECPKIRELQINFGKLTNLQSLIVKRVGIYSLPPSFNKLGILSKLNLQISLRLDGIANTTSWLKDFDKLKGIVAIQLLKRMPSIKDACSFNLLCKPYIEKLILSWGVVATGLWDENHMLEITIEANTDYIKKTRTERELVEDMDLQVLENLQPHPDLKHLQIWNYNCSQFPKWMIGPNLSCASLEELHICECSEIRDLPFRNLGSLKHLRIFSCYNIETISRNSMPSQLQNLIILHCSSVLSITGLENLDSLVELEIQKCERLSSLPFELISEKQGTLGPFKKLKIRKCPQLRLAENKVVPSVHCNIEISDCEGLRRWCLKHKISYKSE